MLYATYTTVPKELLSQPEILEPFLKEVLTPEKKKGFKFLRDRLRSSEYHKDNFVKNRVTFIQEYMMYKKPRFIK